jgi:hypothetical protein
VYIEYIFILVKTAETKPTTGKQSRARRRSWGGLVSFSSCWPTMGRRILFCSTRQQRKRDWPQFWQEKKRAANNCPLFGIPNSVEINNFSYANGRKKAVSD